MDLSSLVPMFALAACLLLTLLGVRRWQRKTGRDAAAREPLDTVLAWPPAAARVLSVDERQAYDLLRRAVPGVPVLAQVPLSRFLRVPTRHSYGDWLQRVGVLSADLLVCDAGTRVVAVVDIRAVEESARGKRRHDRMARVLGAAGIPVLTWREGALPSLLEVRQALMPLIAPPVREPVSAPAEPQGAPLNMPLPEIAELLADGDRAAFATELDPRQEPVSSAFFEELEFELEPTTARAA